MPSSTGEPPPSLPPPLLHAAPPTPPLLPPSSCPHSCFDELNVGLFKGAFAGILWGLYSLQRNLRHPPPPLPPPPSPSSHPPLLLAALTSPRLRQLSPIVVYPAKFAALVGLYHMWTCVGCHLSAPSPPSRVWTPVLAAGLAGLLVAAPQMDWRVMRRSVMGCGVMGGVMGVGHLALHGWTRGSEGGKDNAAELSRRRR